MVATRIAGNLAQALKMSSTAPFQSRNLYSLRGVPKFTRPWSMLLGIDTHLFVKVPGPGDSKGTLSIFESSCQRIY